MYLPKDYKKLLEPYLAAGYTLAPTRGQHVVVLDAAGRRVTTLPGTPGDRRSLLNARAELRQAMRPR